MLPLPEVIEPELPASHAFIAEFRAPSAHSGCAGDMVPIGIIELRARQDFGHAATPSQGGP